MSFESVEKNGLMLDIHSFYTNRLDFIFSLSLSLTHSFSSVIVHFRRRKMSKTLPSQWKGKEDERVSEK
jgi:hypothetical protein